MKHLWLLLGKLKRMFRCFPFSLYHIFRTKQRSLCMYVETCKVQLFDYKFTYPCLDILSNLVVLAFSCIIGTCNSCRADECSPFI